MTLFRTLFLLPFLASAAHAQDLTCRMVYECYSFPAACEETKPDNDVIAISMAEDSVSIEVAPYGMLSLPSLGKSVNPCSTSVLVEFEDVTLFASLSNGSDLTIMAPSNGTDVAPIVAQLNCEAS